MCIARNAVPREMWCCKRGSRRDAPPQDAPAALPGPHQTNSTLHLGVAHDNSSRRTSYRYLEAAVPAFEVAVMSVVRVYWSGESRQQSSGALNLVVILYRSTRTNFFFSTYMTSHTGQDLPQDHHFKQTAKIETTEYTYMTYSPSKLPTPSFTRLGLLDRYLGKARQQL